MNESLSLEILQDDFLRDATKRVLGNILTGFDELSGAEYNKLFDINMDFLVNHIPNIADIPCEITVDNFKYTIVWTIFCDKKQKRGYPFRINISIF